MAPDRPPVRAEDIPQSVVARVVQARIILNEYDAAEEAAAIIAALQDEGYRLVRHDEATVERVARALWLAGGESDPSSDWEHTFPDFKMAYRRMARAALTAAQGGEGRG